MNLANLLGQEVENRRKIADHLTGIKLHGSDKENKELLEKLDLCNQELNEYLKSFKNVNKTSIKKFPYLTLCISFEIHLI